VDGTVVRVMWGWNSGYEEGEEDVGGRMCINRDREDDCGGDGTSHSERPLYL
jgi:hypothetical protein